MEMSLSLRRRRVRIFHDVLRALDMPRCFRFLFDDKTNQLAMQACSFGDTGYHVVPDFQDSDCLHILTTAEIMQCMLFPKIQLTYQYVFKKVFRGNIHIFKCFSPKFLYNHMIKKQYDSL